MRSTHARFFGILLGATLIVAGLIAPRAAMAQTQGASASTSPCNDEVYRELRNRPWVELTESQRSFLERKERECTEYQLATANRRGSAASAPAPAKPAAPASTATSGPSAKSSKTSPPPATPSTKAAPAKATQSTNPSPPAPALTAFKRSPATAEVDDADFERRAAFTFNGGMASPTGLMTDSHKMGFSLGAGFAYPINHRFDLDLVSLGVDHFPLDRDQAEQRPVPPPGGSITIMSLTTGIRSRFLTGHTHPYVALGVGLYRAAHWDLQLSNDETIRGEDWNSFGWSIGGGIEHPVGERSTAFTEVRANFASTAFEYSAYYPVRGGFRIALH